MSILDDAIREHLELKRQHGADDAELKKLEDEAFGPPARPEEELDPFAEAPTEFLVTPGSEAGAEDPTALDLGEEAGSGRRINIADLQEPPPLSEPSSAPESPEPGSEAGPETPGELEAPSEEAPLPDADDRHAIAEQPTELFDVEGQFEGSSEAASPSDDELVDAELSEPRLAPVDPIGGIEASGPTTPAPSAEDDAPPSDEEIEGHADEFDEFFSEQRLSEELSQALEAPLDDEPGFPGTEEAAVPPSPPLADEPTPTDEATAIHPIEEEERHLNFAEEEEDEAEEGDYEDDDYEGESYANEGEDEAEEDNEEEGEALVDDEEFPAARHNPDHQDALEGTPDFLADEPEDESLWFEQKPPKDIDFGD